MEYTPKGYVAGCSRGRGMSMSDEIRERSKKGRVLFGKPPSFLPPPHLLGVEDDPDNGADDSYAPPATFTARPRRPRPRSGEGT